MRIRIDVFFISLYGAKHSSCPFLEFLKLIAGISMGKYGKRNPPRLSINGLSIFEFLSMFGCFRANPRRRWVFFHFSWQILCSDCHLNETTPQNDGSKSEKRNLKKMSFLSFCIFLIFCHQIDLERFSNH